MGAAMTIRPPQDCTTMAEVRAGVDAADRELVDAVSVFTGSDGVASERRADEFRLVSYPTARGCCAAYFPEANNLVHRENVARESNTPGFKAVTVRFEARSEQLA